MTAHDRDSTIAGSLVSGPRVTVDWDHGLAALKRYVAARGSAVMPPAARADGVAVGAWVAARREEYWGGRLDPKRAELLESMPGWDWSGRHQRRWFTVFAALTRFVAKHHIAEIEPGLVFDRVRLGSWVESQRAAFAAGTLPPHNADLLAAIPGWEWAPRRPGTNGSARTPRPRPAVLPERRTADDDRWDAGYTALCAYTRQRGNATPPRDATFDGFALGEWVHEIRRRHRRGDLTTSRAEALERLPGWLWSVADAAWQQGFESLLRYRAAHGTASPTVSVVFDGIRLGAWVRTQRAQYRRGRLAETRRNRLEAVPGWTWNPGRATTDHRELGPRAANRAG
jgi:hypothetical protein